MSRAQDTGWRKVVVTLGAIVGLVVLQIAGKLDATSAALVLGGCGGTNSVGDSGAGGAGAAGTVIVVTYP